MNVIESTKKAEREAIKLLGGTSFLRKQVDVAKIAKDVLGIEIRSMSLDDDITGILKIRSNNGSPVIVVNDNIFSDERRRFTIAHEIGHYILHRNENVHVDGAVFFRDAESRTGSNIKEIEANAFAAALLMPMNDIRNRFSKLNDELKGDENFDKIINQLADFYGVSKQALTIRLGKFLA